MPTVSVWFVRAALAYLVAGFTIGSGLLWHKGMPFAPDPWPLRQAHVEFLLTGWTVQLVLGVALWIFPRFRLGSLPHGRVGLGWWGFALLNAGVGLVAAAPLFGPTVAWPAAAGRAMEIAAVALCVANLWGRVRPGLSQM